MDEGLRQPILAAKYSEPARDQISEAVVDGLIREMRPRRIFELVYETWPGPTSRSAKLQKWMMRRLGQRLKRAVEVIVLPDEHRTVSIGVSVAHRIDELLNAPLIVRTIVIDFKPDEVAA